MFFLEPSHTQHLQTKKKTKTHTKSSKHGARRPLKTASEKHPQKNTTRIEQNNENEQFGGAPETRNEQGKNELVVTFSALGVPGTPLGHPWGPKWSTPPRAAGTPPSLNFR